MAAGEMQSYRYTVQDSPLCVRIKCITKCGCGEPFNGCTIVTLGV